MTSSTIEGMIAPFNNKGGLHPYKILKDVI